MKNSTLVLTVVIISLIAGFSGGFASGFTYHTIQTSSKVDISNFTLSHTVIENSSFTPVGISFRSTSSGSANFLISVSNSTNNFTLRSGSFYRSINYTDHSYGDLVTLDGLSVGTYNITLLVFSGTHETSSDRVLTVIPRIQATITGPHSVNDTSSTQVVTFHSYITGGKGPYRYFWNISNDYYFGNVQNYSFSNNESSSFTVTFFTNPINSGSYGFDNSYFVTLTVEDSLGYSYSVPYPGYVVDVTG